MCQNAADFKTHHKVWHISDRPTEEESFTNAAGKQTSEILQLRSDLKQPQ